MKRPELYRYNDASSGQVWYYHKAEADAYMDTLEARLTTAETLLEDVALNGAQASAAFHEYKRSGNSLDYWCSEAYREASEAKEKVDAFLKATP